MTIQTHIGAGLLLAPYWPPHRNGTAINQLDFTTDAAGEMTAFIGYVRNSGTGSKTLSSSGGKIHWYSGSSVTFANGSTNFRVGIQDVVVGTGPPWRPDETWTGEPYDDLVGGTDTISSNTWQTTTISTGSRSIADGDLIAIVFDMTARGGSDAVKVRTDGASAYSAMNSGGVIQKFAGSWALSTTGFPNAVIEYDDGTFGVLEGSIVHSAVEAIGNYNSGSTPDEYGTIFQVPYKANINKLWAIWRIVANTADAELILYSDPLGTPVAERTFTLDANYGAVTTSARLGVYPVAEFALAANTNYAVALRPTTTNNVALTNFDVGAAGQMFAHLWGTNCYAVSRTDNSGAFSATTTRRFLCGVGFCGFDDGAGGGGGGGIRLAGGGGLAS